LCFNHEEFCDGLYVHRKTCAFAVFLVSGGLFEGWVALGPTRTAPFGPPGRSPARFRWFRWRPKLPQIRQNPATDPHRRQAACFVAPLPRQPSVGHARACQPELRVRSQDQPRPAVGLLRMPNPRSALTQVLLEEAKCVLHVEAPGVGPPEQVQQSSGVIPGPGPPCHHSHTTRGSRRLAPRGSRATS
jgi:hypothetical protein